MLLDSYLSRLNRNYFDQLITGVDAMAQNYRKAWSTPVRRDELRMCLPEGQGKYFEPEECIKSRER